MEALENQVDIIKTRFYREVTKTLCPKCGYSMIESDRLREAEYTFIWFRCGKNDCLGQWFQIKMA